MKLNYIKSQIAHRRLEDKYLNKKNKTRDDWIKVDYHFYCHYAQKQKNRILTSAEKKNLYKKAVKNNAERNMKEPSFGDFFVEVWDEVRGR